MDTDVIGNLDDIINDAEEDDDVRSSAGSTSIKDEIDGIGSVDSSYFNKRLSDLEPPQGPPVDSKYTSGIYRRRGTLGVDSSEVQGQPQPSQTVDDGNRGHSRQKRQTTTTMRTNSVPVLQSTASPQANPPQIQETRGEHSEIIPNGDDGAKNTSIVNVVGPGTTTESNGVFNYPVNGPGQPPGGSKPSSQSESEEIPGASPGVVSNDNKGFEPFHPEVEGGDVGRGDRKDNWQKSGSSGTYSQKEKKMKWNKTTKLKRKMITQLKVKVEPQVPAERKWNAAKSLK